MSIIMILVIYNTIVGLMAFASRFTTPFSKQYFVLIIVMTIVTFISLSALFHSLAKYFQLWGYLALFYSFLFYIKG